MKCNWLRFYSNLYLKKWRNESPTAKCIFKFHDQITYWIAIWPMNCQLNYDSEKLPYVTVFKKRKGVFHAWSTSCTCLHLIKWNSICSMTGVKWQIEKKCLVGELAFSLLYKNSDIHSITKCLLKHPSSKKACADMQISLIMFNGKVCKCVLTVGCLW